MKTADPTLPPHFRRNFVIFLIDYVFFGIAFSFAGPNTVMPDFARTLTDSEPLIGLVGMAFSAGWLLPQLGVAAMIGSRPRRKPYLLAATYVGRPIFLFLALAVWAGLPRWPMAMLAVLLVSVGLFSLLDGIASVAWFDILARAVPLARRGRLVGAGQLLGGLSGIGVGALVMLILGAPSLPYPRNYALLFALSAVAHVPSLVALTLLREPEGEPVEPRRPPLDFLRQLGEVWRGDRDFRRLMGSRWLVGLTTLAIPFYVIHAKDVLGLPEAATGWFISAQMAGGIAASLGLGWLSERKGPRPAIWLGAATALLGPLLALTAHFVRGELLPLVYSLVYFLFGVTNNSWMLGPLNYVLEMAPAGRRPLYVGLYNTLAGILVPASLVGGVILRLTSYPILFGLAAAGSGAGLWLSLGLREHQQGEV